LILSTPYNPDFVRELKFAVPWRSRRWDQNRKQWIIDAVYEDQVRELVAQYFQKESIAPEDKDFYQVLHLRPTAPFELVCVAYEVLSKLCEGEPDEKVRKKELEVAYLAIERERMGAKDGTPVL